MDWSEFWDSVTVCTTCHALVFDNYLDEHERFHRANHHKRAEVRHETR